MTNPPKTTKVGKLEPKVSDPAIDKHAPVYMGLVKAVKKDKIVIITRRDFKKLRREIYRVDKQIKAIMLKIKNVSHKVNTFMS